VSTNITDLDFRNALFTSFAAAWADATPIATQNDTFDPAKVSGDAFVRLVLTGQAEGETALSSSVARDHVQREGTLTVQVYVREGTDMDQTFTLLEAVKAWAKHPGAAETLLRSIGTPVPIGSDGAWFQTDLSMTWLYWSSRAA